MHKRSHTTLRPLSSHPIPALSQQQHITIEALRTNEKKKEKEKRKKDTVEEKSKWEWGE